MADRLDIRNIMNSEANINILSNVLMEPYQMKIISHVKKGQDDSTKLTNDVPIDAAIEELK